MTLQLSIPKLLRKHKQQRTSFYIIWQLSLPPQLDDASDIILHINSDASYLSVSHAHSRLGGLLFCGDKPPNEDNLNGSIHNVATVIKNVVASAAESEVGVGVCFQNAQSGAPIRITLIELGHKQPATPLRTDNSTAFGILNETIKQKRSKAMDMRYHWLIDRVRQKKCILAPRT
jgi:hypothetical protein